MFAEAQEGDCQDCQQRASAHVERLLLALAFSFCLIRIWLRVKRLVNGTKEEKPVVCWGFTVDPHPYR